MAIFEWIHLASDVVPCAAGKSALKGGGADLQHRLVSSSWTKRQFTSGDRRNSGKIMYRNTLGAIGGEISDGCPKMPEFVRSEVKQPDERTIRRAVGQELKSHVRINVGESVPVESQQIPTLEGCTGQTRMLLFCD